MSTRLTAKQEAYALALFQGVSSRQAYRSIYNAARWTDNSVDVQASRLANNPKIRLRVGELRSIAAAQALVTVDRTLQEAAAIAYSDIGEIVTWRDGSFTYRASEDLPERVRRAIQSLKVKRRREVLGRGEDAEVWEVEEMEFKLWDKIGALDKLMRHLGMYPKDGVTVNVDNRKQSMSIALEGAGLSVEQLRQVAMQMIEGDE